MIKSVPQQAMAAMEVELIANVLSVRLDGAGTTPNSSAISLLVLSCEMSLSTRRSVGVNKGRPVSVLQRLQFKC